MFMPTYTMHGFNWHDERGREGIGFVRALRNVSTVHLPPMIPDLMTIISNGLVEGISSGKKFNGLSPSLIDCK